jgi:hypothetical protein
MFAMSGSRLIIELQTAVIVCSDGSVVVIAGGCRPEIKYISKSKSNFLPSKPRFPVDEATTVYSNKSYHLHVSTPVWMESERTARC